MNEQTPVAMSLRAFAKLLGVTPMAVSAGCKTGRLRKSIARDPTGRVLGITDPALATVEWAQNSDVSKAPLKEQVKAIERQPEIARLSAELSGSPVSGDSDDASTLENASAQAKLWDARLKELKYRKAAGELVPAADVERDVRDTFTHCKARLLSIPSALRQLYPDLTVDHMNGVDRLLREALEELAAPSLTVEAEPELEFDDLPELEEPV